MSKEKYTHIIGILDRSGSIQIIRKDIEGGFNSFIDEQKSVDGEATMTLVQFDYDVESVFENLAIEDVPKLTLSPRGSTSLLDAIGSTLESERERIMAMDADKQPEKVICIILTDGEENSSRQYNRAQIFEMINDLEGEEDIQWDFVFVGANQDAIAEGGNIGVRASSAMTYDASSQGTQVAFQSLSRSLKSYRTASVGEAYSFSDEDREEQERLINNVQSIPNHITDLASDESEKEKTE